MRSLEECRAEVFARSEKRIAKRRKIRRRVAAGLAPLCLCIVLLAILPMMSFQKSYECKPEGIGNAECAGEPADESEDTTRQQATVIRKNGERWMLSEDQTKQLTCLLNECLAVGIDTENNREADFEIEILAADGNMIRYLLSGSRLTCDNLAAELTESQLQQILWLLQPVSE